jgi:hypothetical protein
VAGEVATAYVRLRPTGGAAFKKEAEAQVKGALGGIGKAAAFGVGFAGLAEGIKSTLEAAAGKQTAVAQIETTVKNAGAAWVVYGKNVTEALDEQENRSGFDFEELAQGFGRLEQQIKNTPKALKVLESAEDVARARHLQLSQVTVALARAYAGNAQSLSRLGIVIPKYTANADALKAKLRDLAIAQEAQTLSQDKNYDGQRKLTAEQQRLKDLSPSQLKNLIDQTKAQVDAAKAADKRAGAEQAIAEVGKRYAGQTEAYTKTAAGAYAQFRVAIQQVEEELGGAALPQLTKVAKGAAELALNLSKNESVAAGVRGGLDQIAGGASAVATAFKAVEPLLSTIAGVAQAIGPGPILATYAAYKALAVTQGIVVATEGRYQGIIAKGAAVQAGRVAALQAGVDITTVAVEAEQAHLALILEMNPGISAQTAALIANMDANIARTEAEVAAIEAELGLAAATEVATVAEVEQTAASVALTEALAAQGVAQAALDAEKGLGGLALAGRGLASVLTSPTGLIAGAALLAGGLYYLSTQSSPAEEAAKRLKGDYDELATAAHDAASAQDTLNRAGLDLSSARLGKNTAADALRAARAQLAKDEENGADPTKLIADADAIAQAEDRWRHANLDLIESEKRKQAAVKASSDAVKGQRETTEKLLTDQLKLAALNRPANTPYGFGNAAIADKAVNGAGRYADALLKLADTSKTATDQQKFALRQLADYAKAVNKIPSDKEIELVLNDKQFYATLQKDLGVIKAAGGALVDALLGRNQEVANAAGGRDFGPEVKTKLKKTAKDAADTYSQSFVQTIDTSSIGQALVDSIAQAQDQLSSLSSSFADSIANVLDARLKATTAPLTREIATLQAQIDATSRRSGGRDAEQALADAKKKFDDLSRIFGPGAHTADQAQQLAQAQVALLDAQDTLANQGRQGRIDQLQGQVDTATKAEEAQKTAAAKRLSDLAAELDDGLITQKQYVTRLQGLLRGLGVNYKATGRLLGQSLADGFRDGLSSILGQAAKLGDVGPGKLKGAARGTKAIDPLAVEGAALQAIVDQIAQSGGRFRLTGKLPAGVTENDLLGKAGAQRASDLYLSKGDQIKGLQYQGKTSDHTAMIVDELRKLNAKDTKVVVHVDGKKANAKTARATRS